ncbi:hypothetical protein M5D96_005124, partial [Drosophila gunungcola]
NTSILWSAPRRSSRFQKVFGRLNGCRFSHLSSLDGGSRNLAPPWHPVQCDSFRCLNASPNMLISITLSLRDPTVPKVATAMIKNPMAMRNAGGVDKCTSTNRWRCLMLWKLPRRTLLEKLQSAME